MKNFTYFALLLGILLYACQSNPNQKQTEETGPVKVAAVNYPLTYMARQIATDDFMISFPIPMDVDPAYWEPDNIGLAQFQEAGLILANGAGYEKWMDKVSLPQSKIVVTSDVFSDHWIELTEGTTHSHGPEGEHEHLGYAFTTWLNFKYTSMQAFAIKEALIKLMPDQKDTLTARFEILNSELMKLDENMTFVGESIGDQFIIGSHPVYQYLAEGYDLDIESLHWEPDEFPAEEQWKELAHLIEHHGGNMMLWEDEPLQETRQELEKMGLKIFIFNPCANRPETGDFISVMKKNIDDLVKEFC